MSAGSRYLAVFAGARPWGIPGVGWPQAIANSQGLCDPESYPGGWCRDCGGQCLSLLCLRGKEIAKKEKAQESENTIAAREVRGLTGCSGEPVFSCEGRVLRGELLGALSCRSTLQVTVPLSAS